MIFRTLVAFELRHQVASPLFLVSFAIFFLLSFGATTLDEIQIGSRGNVWKNSPFAIAQAVAVLNLFAMFVTTAFAANAVVRDDETGFSPILRSTRIRKTSYLAGRFVGAGIVSALVCLAVPIGILVGSLMPWQDPEKIGPLIPGHYVHAVLVFGLPTQVVLAAFFFAVATATRSMMWTYVGVVAFLVGYTASRFLLGEDQHEVLSALLDPFGLGAMGRATQYWTASDRNRLVVPFEGLLLWNRVLWLGLAAIASGVALKVFRMEERPAKGASSRNPAPEEATDATTKARPSTTQARLVPATAGRPGGAWAQCLALARMETSLVLRSPAFLVLVALGVFNALGGLSGVAEFRGVASLP